MPQHIKPTPFRSCEECGKTLQRKRQPNGDLEYMIHFLRRKFCDRKCMGRNFDARPVKDDPSYATAHHHSRKMIPPGMCEKCGVNIGTDVHHKDGDWQNNDPSNLTRICRSCHNKEHRTRATCSLCERPVKGLGYCDKHYQRFKRHGDARVVKTNQHVTARFAD